MKKIQIMGKKVNSNLIFDIDALKEFIFTDDGVRNSDIEITETQVRTPDGSMKPENKIIREVKSNDSSRQTIRYDLLRQFIDALDEIDINQEYSNLTLGQQMILNTMAQYGLIKEIN